jgi:hypothetical protein
MVKRYKGGLISATESTTSTTVSSGMWSATVAAQARKAGAWPSLLASEPPASTGGGTGPTISNVSVTNSSYTVLNDTPYISTAGGYIKITGTGFVSGCTVYYGGNTATTTTFVSATEVRAQIGAASSNSYMVYVVNPDSSTGILLNAITFSGTPTWVTGATLIDQLVDVAFSIQFSATSDSSVTYALTAGSSTPSGTTLYSNGVFSGTVTGLSVDTNYSFSVDAIDAENQDTARTFTVNVGLGDPYFNITPLLLNGEANVWIKDSSTNNFLPTVTGDIKPTAFSPYDANWSVYLNGASYLDVAASTTFNEFLTGDYTIECWFHYTGTAFTSGPCLISCTTSWTTSSAFDFEVRTGGIVYYFAGDTNQVQLVAGGGQAVSINTWNHAAVVRYSGVTTLYVNGANAAASSTSVSISKPSQLMRIGAFSQGGGQQWTGYISNARIVKGQAAYTANFTPSTTSLTTTSQGITSANVFLGCSTNRFIDANTTPKTISIGSGAPLANTFTPFTETDTITGSAYFDGNGDNLQYASNSAFAFGTGTYTVEAWVYVLSVPASAAAVFDAGSATGSFGLSIVNTTRNLFVNTYGSGQLSTLVTSSAVPLNQWTHVAVCRASTASNDTRLFINGVLSGTGTDATNWTVTTTPMVGYNAGGSGYYFSGYMTDMRVIKGSALYTASFTPPTSSLSAVANTQLLTLQYRRGENNHRFVDEGGRTYIATRNGQVSQGSFSPFSPAGWSAYFDGTGDYLTFPELNISSSTSFTIEFWFYWSASPSTYSMFVSDDNGNSSKYIAYNVTGATLEVQTGGSAGTTAYCSFTPILNTWYHLAFVRNTNTVTIYVNGVAQAMTQATQSGTFLDQGTINYIGRWGGTTPYAVTGYMSNFRAVVGLAVYTGNFTTPTSILGNTQSAGSNIAAITSGSTFLSLQNNRFVDNGTNASAITRFGDARIQAFSPFKPSAVYNPTTHGGSAYFDGTGDYLKALATSMTLLPTSSTNTFTVDGWIYPTTTGTRYWIVGDLDPAGGTNNVAVDVSSTNKIELYWYTGVANRATSADSVVPNQWNYFAVVVNANAITIYVNSTTAGQTGTTTLTTRNLGTSGWGINGANNAEQFAGYLSSIRWSTGIARTISSIPTAPTEPDNYSTFLMKFNNAGVVDVTGRHNFETLGNVTISNAASKFGTGSLYFDGTSDGLYEPYNPQYAFGTGDFTIEFWMNFSSKTGYQTIMVFGYTAAVTGGWLVQTGNGDGNLIFYFGSGSSTVVASESGSTVNTGTWYHIMIVKTGGNTRIYRNGTQVATGADTNNYTPATTTRFYIGGGDTVGFGNYYFNGYLDDIRITRFARTVAVPTSAFLTK